MKFRIRFFKKQPVFAYVYNCLNDSVKALLIAWNSKVFALTGCMEPTCETSVNHVFLKENLSLSKSTAKEEVCTVGLFEDRL
ncbi:MAG: hypothetical protein ACLS3J_02510 [Segatella copri]